MIIADQEIESVWNGRNRKRYESFGYKYTNMGDKILIKYEYLSKGSKTLIDVNCDQCGEKYKLSNYQANRAENHICSANCKYLFGKTKVECRYCSEVIYRNDSQLGKNESENYFCSNACVGKYNAETRLYNIHKKCLMCDETFKVIPATEDERITCSRECQALWQSTYLIGENANNFKGGNIKLVCLECKHPYETRRYTKDTSKFCSQKCKQSYWVKNVLHNEEFKKNHYEGNLKWRQQANETLPERLVREWLDNNSIQYKQEQGFFRKYYADFWILKTRIVIEVFGNYWHSNPKVYGEDLLPLSESQKIQIVKDEERIRTFIGHGFTVVILWESDIYEDIDKLMNEKFLTIYPRNDYTQNIQLQNCDSDIV